MTDYLSLEQNIMKIPQGDMTAFQDVYETTKTAVYCFALSIVPNSQDAEDIMHDAYLRIYRSAADYKPMGKPLAWIMTIVRNLALNRIRDAKPREDFPVRRELLQDSFTDKIENRVLLESLLSRLEKEEHQIIVLHVMADWKFREIAEWLGLPLATVTSKYRRALKKMKKAME